MFSRYFCLLTIFATAILLPAAGGVSVAGDDMYLQGGYKSGDDIYGGSATNPATSNAKVILSTTDTSGTLVGQSVRYVNGGYHYTTDLTPTVATDNSVVISGGVVTGVISGGSARALNTTSATATATANRNLVGISGTAVSNFAVYGGYAEAYAGAPTANDNRVTIFGGVFTLDISGGRAATSITTRSTATATANNNIVSISAGTFNRYVFGAETESYEGASTACGNTVNISGGIFNDRVHGGSANAFDTTAATASTKANGNMVNITGGSINSSVYGGYTNSSNTAAEDNTVRLSGSPTFSGSTDIYGGYGEYNAAALRSKTFKGNELILDSYRGTDSVRSIGHFQYLSFILDENSQPLLAGTVVFGDGAGTKSSLGYINIAGAYAPKVGDEVSLIEANTMNADSIELGEVTGKKLGGASTATYRWALSVLNNSLVATLKGVVAVEIKPQTKSLLEGRMAATTFLNQAADMVSGAGMNAMLDSVSKKDFSIWGETSGGVNRYNTGSHINTHGISFMIGAAWRKCTGPGTLALSPFFAFGWGNYTSHNAFSGIGSVKGKGNTNYQGGGLMARYNHTNTGWYGEASVQLGHVKQDYKSSDFLDNYLNDTKYAINQMYTSMHIGIGKEIALSNCSVLDVYGKYFWTHTGKKDRDISGDVYKFAAVNSHRARFGARYTYTAATGSGEVKPYAGAAYEYEFNGKGRGTANGFRIADTRLQGSTGLLEAGIDYAPCGKKWTLNAGATGFVGKRRGIMGQLGISADF